MKPELVDALLTSGSGSVIGTVLKTLLAPEPSLKRWLVQTITSLIVGVILGSAIAEWMEFGKAMSVATGCGCALMSEQIIKFIQVRGKKLEKGEIDISLKSDREGGGESNGG